MVTIDRFLEPTTFGAKRLFTGMGSLDGEIPGAIGDQPYRFPLIKAETLYLCPTDFSPYYGYPYYFPSYGYWRFNLHWGVHHGSYHGYRHQRHLGYHGGH